MERGAACRVLEYIEGGCSCSPPTPQQIHNDHCPECKDVAARFSGKRWSEVSVASLQTNVAVSLLNPIAFLYYLPALLLLSVEAWEQLDCLPESLVSSLSPPGREWRRILREVALVFAGADVHVCLPVKEIERNQRRRPRRDEERVLDARECTNWLG